MKFILLLSLLAACGKHTMPPMENFQTNQYETGSEKFLKIAEHLNAVSEIKKINGTFSFSGGSDKKRRMESSLSEKNLSQEVLGIMARDKSLIKPNLYFGEWTRIQLNNTFTAEDITDQQSIDVRIIFENMSVTPYEIAIITGENINVLRGWSKSMSVTLSREDFLSLQNSDAHLAINLQGERDKRRKLEAETYKVMFFDGANTNLLHINNNFPIKSFLNSMEVYDLQEADEIDFRKEGYDGKRWWIREVTSGETFLAYASPLEIKNQMIKEFKKSEIEVIRTNGIPQITNLKKKKYARIYFEIETEVSMLTFKDEVVSTYINDFGGMTRYDTYRFVAAEKIIKFAANDISTELKIFEDGVLVPAERYSLIRKTNPQGEVVWEGAVDSESENLQWSMAAKDPGTFNVTGLIDSRMDPANYPGKPISPVPTHPESHMKLRIHTYVEKLK